MKPTNDAECFALVRMALLEAAKIELTQLDGLTMDSELRDVAIDSVMSLSVIGYLEDKLETQFPDDLLARARTLRDLVHLVRWEPK